VLMVSWKTTAHPAAFREVTWASVLWWVVEQRA